MYKVGFVGWRGMVGSVLLQRMIEEDDFKLIQPFFFSTSQINQNGPTIFQEKTTLLDAYNIKSLSDMDIIVTCQGSQFTKEIYPILRKKGWKGFWIDAASELRMHQDSTLILDPVNKDSILRSLNSGIKTFVGANCTVSLMLMALHGLINAGVVEWISVMTYQAASGAGSQFIKELLSQMGTLYNSVANQLANTQKNILDIDRSLSNVISSSTFPIEHFKAPLAGSLIPFIDQPMPNGQSKEEWKAQIEANKILNLNENKTLLIDGICVRIGAIRAHSQALTIKLKKNITISQIENLINAGNSWVNIVPNDPQKSIEKLTPSYVNGSLNIQIGRIKKLNFSSNYISAFTVGDQLLWGASEPIRRMLMMMIRSSII